MQDNDTQNKQAQLSPSLETTAALVAEQCFNDKAFGEKFLADPKTALAELSLKQGRRLELGDRKVYAHENDAHNWHIVLPHLKPRAVLGQYSAEEVQTMKDSDLRKLAGGEVVFVATIIATAGITAGVAVTAGGVAAATTANKKK